MVSGFGVSGGLLVLPAFIALRSCSVRDGESGAAKYVDDGLNVGEKVNGAALLRCEPAVDGRCELLPFEALTDMSLPSVTPQTWRRVGQWCVSC